MLPRTLLTAYAVLLAGLVLHPFAAPGALIHRDMVVLPHPELGLSALGFGDLPARNAPQDGLLGIAGMLVDATIITRLLLLTAALAGAYGAVLLARHVGAGAWGAAAAMTITIVNPFVVERLLQGHWSLVIAAWLLPGVAAWGLQGHTLRQLVGMWLCSLTPTGALAALIVGTVSSRHRWISCAGGALACLPWLVPALIHPATSSAAGAQAFAPRAEAGVSTLGALAGLGGIWNAQAVPSSREAGFAIAGIVLFFLLLFFGARRCPRPLLWLAATGAVLLTLSVYAPTLTSWAIVHIPGAALWRDSHKLLLLLIPAYAASAAGIRPRAGLPLVIALCFVQVPDAATAVGGALRPAAVDPSWQALSSRAQHRDVLFPDAPTIIRLGDTIAIDPRTKAAAVVEGGELTVDGTRIDPPSTRYVAANEAWQRRDLQALENLGVGLIITPEETMETAAAPRRGWRYTLGLILTVTWLSLPLLYAATAQIARRFPPTKTAQPSPAPQHPNARGRRDRR